MYIQGKGLKMKKDKNIIIRVSEKELAIISKKAELLDMSVSEYIRQASINKQVKGFKSVDVEESSPVYRLGYNETTQRFGLLKSDLFVDDGFHCGDCFQVKINGEWIDTRIEMTSGQEWYLVGTKLKGRRLENLQIRL